MPRRPLHCWLFHDAEDQRICTSLLGPCQKKTYLDHSCYSCHAWWFSRAGCRIFQKQLCASEADRAPAQKGFYLFPFSLSKKNSFPPPPSPSISMLGSAPGLTQTHSRPEISAHLPFSPPSSAFPWTYPSGSAEKLPSLRMTLDHFSPPAHSSQRGGQGRGAAAVSALWLYHYRAADMYTVYQAQAVISILYSMMTKYKAAFVGTCPPDPPWWQQ